MKYFLYASAAFVLLALAALLSALSLERPPVSPVPPGDTAAAYGLVWEDGVLCLRFPEPVVPLGVVRGNVREPIAQRGLELVSPPGCPVPSLRWVDQDELLISFAEDSSPADVHHIKVMPGARYLGGAPLEQTCYTFSPRPVRLELVHLKEYEGGAVLISAAGADTREARALVQRYEGLSVRFHRLRRSLVGGWVRDGVVPATLRPATLADAGGACPRAAEAMLRHNAPGSIRPDTPLPQTLLALPAQPLEPGLRYCLEVCAEPGSGFVGAVEEFELPRGLEVSLHSWLSEPEAGQPVRPALELSFNAPVGKEALRRLWRRMEVRLAGQSARLSEDGQSYRACVDGRELCLRLRGLQSSRRGCYLHMGDKAYSVEMPDCADGLEMELQADAPLAVELTLPRDFRAAQGLAPLERKHALRVNPAWPLWCGTGNLVPLGGPHLLRLPAVNIGAASVSLHHWDAEAAARLFPLIRRARRDDCSLLELACRQGWLQQQAGQWPLRFGALGQLRHITSHALGMVRQDRIAQAGLRRRIFAEGRAFPAVPLKVEGAPDAFASRGDILLDLDAAAGGAAALRPGLYLVRLCSQPTAPVRAELDSLGLRLPGEAQGGTDDPQGWQVEYLVQVTDIGLRQGSGYLVAGSLASGEPLEQVRLTAYELEEEEGGGAAARPARATDCRLDMPQGAGKPAGGMEGKLLLVQCGEDYRLASLADAEERYDRPACEDEAGESQQRLELFCDRPLYRPGETAHLRGVLRDMGGTAPALPAAHELELRVYRPGGELMETRQLALDAYGAVTADIELPAGEEDVTGRYCCELCLGELKRELGLRCEVFRRNAFEVELQVESDPVAPKELCTVVSARNYDGTPLRGGKAVLEFDTWEDILMPQGSVKVREHKVELQLDAEGRARCRLPLAPPAGYVRLGVWADVSNAQEEHVPGHAFFQISPCDFRVCWDAIARRLHLVDTRSGEPLAREQVLELRIRHWGEDDVEVAPGITDHDKEQWRELLRREICVPAGCAEGMDLAPLLKELDVPGRYVTVELSGRDAEGRVLKARFSASLHRGERPPCMEFSVAVEGKALRVHTKEDWGAARLHAFIGSQGRLRHALATRCEDGSLLIPLQDTEYGSMQLHLLRCMPGANGADARWESGRMYCERPRPDKLLAVGLTLPQGAKPGGDACIGGRVTDAAGKPVRAGVTVFAVDAGMLGVAPYSLPRLAERFYRGHVPRFGLDYLRRLTASGPGIRTMRLSLKDVGWGLPDARSRDLWLHWGNWGSFEGLGESAQLDANAFLFKALLSLYDDMPPTFLSYVPSGAFEEGLSEGGSGLGSARSAPPRLRRDFAPVALWQGCVETAEDGSFRCPLTLPDTLTTYRVFAVALGGDGSSFGQGEGDFLVSQPLMLSAGTPFFMSLGDRLQLPLTITNNSGGAGRWSVSLDGAGETPAQQVELAAGETKTLFFELTAQAEGERVLRWTATGGAAGDAVEASFPVLYPAPLLKEHHHLVLEAGETLDAASLLAPELAAGKQGAMSIEYSTSPLLHLGGSFDYLLGYPYGCTEQTASALLPWLFHKELAPHCPQMAQTDAAQVEATVRRSIHLLLGRQQADGGLAYWGSATGERHESCYWATAYAGLVLTIAQERGYAVPAEAMDKLRAYLARQEGKSWASPLVRYATARVLGRQREAREQLELAIEEEEQLQGCGGLRCERASLRFLAELADKPAARHDALLRWLRGQGRDARHHSTWSSGWQLIALGEYLRHEGPAAQQATLLVGGEAHAATAARSSVDTHEAAATLEAQQGRVYVSVKVRALPRQTDYPGVTEKGLQVTRVYETKCADGTWRESTDWKVGDVVRVTLTCAKAARELQYFVLEDKLPACLEAINPRVPGQAAGIGGECLWSPCIDHKEYLADRVRAFCTRWPGRELLNMSYYARVKRAGECTAPPAEAQLMYEPQVYGLSPNTRVRSRH